MENMLPYVPKSGNFRNRAMGPGRKIYGETVTGKGNT